MARREVGLGLQQSFGSAAVQGTPLCKRRSHGAVGRRCQAVRWERQTLWADTWAEAGCFCSARWVATPYGQGVLRL